MKKLIICYLPDWKLDLKVNEWKVYLTNVGGDIYRENDNMIITWENDNMPTVVHHILDVIDDLLGDEWWLGGLTEEINNLDNDFTIIFDNMCGSLEVR